MELRQWSQEDVASRAGVVQRTVGNMMDPLGPSPKLDSVDKVASAFGLEGWHLIVSTLIDDLKAGGTISRLFDAYLNASPDGRRHILRIAEREAEYHTTKNGTDDPLP